MIAEPFGDIAEDRVNGGRCSRVSGPSAGSCRPSAPGALGLYVGEHERGGGLHIYSDARNGDVLGECDCLVDFGDGKRHVLAR